MRSALQPRFRLLLTKGCFRKIIAPMAAFGATADIAIKTVIFNAAEFLDAGVMPGTLVGIGVIGVVFERFVFQTLEQITVRRWGMVAGPQA